MASVPLNEGRGALSNTTGRYESWGRERCDDGWCSAGEETRSVRTTLTPDTSRTVISYNASPDVPFDRSVNPYRGCEHGCVYCFARPSHAWLGFSPGLDFESRLLYKPDAPELLRRELGAARYRCATLALGANTDPYQPVERRLGITRRVLEVLEACNHPATVVTKSALVERDRDILSAMAGRRLAAVAVSITTLNTGLARVMEPRAAAPARRLATVTSLAKAGIPVTVLVAPVIPILTDGEMEAILTRAAEAGARHAGWSLLRLPLEIQNLFTEWLHAHFPTQAARVMQRLRDTRGGKNYESAFGTRMRGIGPYAGMIAQRFDLATRRLGFTEAPALDCSQFHRPASPHGQLSLF